MFVFSRRVSGQGVMGPIIKRPTNQNAIQSSEGDIYWVFHSLRNPPPLMPDCTLQCLIIITSRPVWLHCVSPPHHFFPTGSLPIPNLVTKQFQEHIAFVGWGSGVRAPCHQPISHPTLSFARNRHSSILSQFTSQSFSALYSPGR